MTKEEIIKAEQIREEVRKVINQMLDEEYEDIIKRIETGEAKITTKSMTDIIDHLLSQNKPLKD